MKPVFRFACAAASVLLGACVCSALFALISPVSASCSDLLSIINIIILCVVFVMICASGILNYYMISENQTGKREIDLNFCSSILSAEISTDLPQSDLCSICLASLVDKTLEIRKMTCCKNIVHSECMREYLMALISDRTKAPCCIFCRSNLSLSRTLSV